MKSNIESARSLFKSSLHNISLLSNASAFLNETLKDINWVGFYLYHDNKLILGPFQGKVACEVINLNEGVCGYSFSNKVIANIDDVHRFEGHIACDYSSNSELVIPLFKDSIPIGVLDIDSPLFNRFDEDTVNYVKEIAELIINYYQI